MHIDEFTVLSTMVLKLNFSTFMHLADLRCIMFLSICKPVTLALLALEPLESHRK